MLPYWLLFGVFAFGAPTARAYRRDEPMLLFWFGAIAVTLMIGLRYRVGVDWGNYLGIWEDAAALDLGSYLDSYSTDPAFYTLVWSLNQAGLPFWMLNLIGAIIFTSGLFRFARLQPSPWLAVAVAVPYLVIVVAMSGLRQSMALGFVFHALVAFREQRATPFLLLVAAAAACHASAILMLPFAGLSFARTRFQAGLLLLLIAFGAVFLLSGTFGEYSRDYLHGRVTVQSSGAPYRVAMTLAAALLFFSLRARLQIPPHELTLWRNLSLVALASVPLLLVVPSSTAVDRMLLYLYPLQMVVLTHAPYAMSWKPIERVLAKGVILIYLGMMLFVFMNYAVNRHQYLPYRMYPYSGT